MPPVAIPVTGAPVAPSTVELVLAGPFPISAFISGVDGWDDIVPEGTTGPSTSADQVIAAGVSSGVTVEKR